MDALQKLVSRFFIAVIFFATIGCAFTPSQPGSISWSQTKMDTTVYNLPSAGVQAILDKYSPLVAEKMNAVVGQTAEGLPKSKPESPMSNFAADALLSVARAYKGSDEAVDFSLINMGGIRSGFPAGDVKLYDVYSSFPFENFLVIVDIKGSVIYELFNYFAVREVQAISGASVKISGGKVVEATVGGKKLDPDKIYHMVTPEFVFHGGDGMTMFANNEKVEETGLLVRDVILTYIGEFTKAGEVLPSIVDSRVVVIED